MPYLILTDLNGNTYNLPPSMDIKAQKISANSSVKKLLYAHGGRELGDMYFKPRTITVEGSLYASTEAGFETAKRAFIAAVMKGGYLSVSNDQVTRRIAVSLIDIDDDIFEYQIMNNVSVTFMAEYPFWEDSTTTTTKVASGNTSFTVNATGADDIIIPEIEVNADQGADVPSVKMWNQNDGGLAFSYNDPSFFATDILIINGKAGTVKKNNNDGMLYFNPPYFLRLQPLSNTIYYEGAAATIKVRWRKVYI